MTRHHASPPGCSQEPPATPSQAGNPVSSRAKLHLQILADVRKTLLVIHALVHARLAVVRRPLRKDRPAWRSSARPTQQVGLALDGTSASLITTANAAVKAHVSARPGPSTRRAHVY